ncbi:hypothetical protein ACFPIJ_01080 [Dactylosporangium cerinum]|uniref:Uncharacterized protein n=1 Tax=Dactylosporangium cerinum TaxID=1434730 RepID=A0ABV9VL13_9ACTN
MAIEFVHDEYILVLDGRVLEIFRRHGQDTQRYHVAFLGVYVKPKGDRFKVQVGLSYGEQVLGGTTLTLDQVQFARFQEFIGYATAARDSAPNPPR